MNQNILKVALDLGNGNMKGAMVVDAATDPATGEPSPKTEKLMAVVTLPSQVGVGDTNLGLLDLGGVVKRKREQKPVQIKFDGGEYLVGHNVAHYTRPLERLDPGKYVDSMEVRALTYALLAQLLDGGPTDVAAIIALPVEITMASNAREIVKEIEAWLVGEHRFTCDGQDACITIHAIRAMAQPVGAFFAWGLDNTGQWVRAESDLTDASVAVLDSGFNTLDLFAVRQGRIEKTFIGGETLGVRRAAEEIIRVVKAKYGYTMSRIEADAYIRAYLEKRSTQFGRGVDLKPIIRQAITSLATQTIDFVEKTWGAENPFTYILLSGGGALVLSDAIRKLLPHAQVLPDPVTANAVGLARLAQRPGVFKGL